MPCSGSVGLAARCGATIGVVAHAAAQSLPAGYTAPGPVTECGGAPHMQARKIARGADGKRTFTVRPLPYPYWHQAKTAADRLSPADLALLAPYLEDYA